MRDWTLEASIIIAVIAVLLVVALWLLRKRKEAQLLPPEAPSEPAPAPQVEEERVPEVPLPAVPDLGERLSRTRTTLWSRMGGLLSRSASDPVDRQEWDALEEALLEGDVGVRTVDTLLERVRQRLKSEGNGHDLREVLQEESEELLAGLDHGWREPAEPPRPLVISIVGVNGVGKTTTIGKLAHRFCKEQKQVLMGAGDTFRAAAISQLKIWAERTGSQFVTGREGADPGAVAFDSVSAGKARGMDVVLLDTAGRLHTKANLMEELKKIHRVVKKVIPEAPHEVWLVVDGTMGQNSLHQAREFQKALELTGLIVTKLDGTAKGGALLSIAQELQLPIRFIGVGEGVDDLIPFEPRPYISAILGGAGSEARPSMVH